MNTSAHNALKATLCRANALNAVKIASIVLTKTIVLYVLIYFTLYKYILYNAKQQLIN